MKKILALILSLSLVFVLNACGSKDADTTSTDTAAETLTDSEIAEQAAQEVADIVNTDTDAQTIQNDISMGMSYEEVTSVMGNGGSSLSTDSTSDSDSSTYEWTESDGSINMMTFDDNGELISRSHISVTYDTGEITLAQYNKLKEGMTYDEVYEVLGCDGDLVTETNMNGSNIKMYTWNGTVEGSYCNIGFTDGKVSSLSQSGLE